MLQQRMSFFIFEVICKPVITQQEVKTIEYTEDKETIPLLSPHFYFEHAGDE